MPITRVTSFSEVYARNTCTTPLDGGASSDITYHDGNGYHVYTQLSLLNELTNPNEKNNLEKFFEVIQRYSDLVSCCLNGTQGKILEVQGERIHIFFPYELTTDSAAEVVGFCAALTNAVYDNKYRLGNSIFNGFKICFSHGRAIILSTGNDATDSLVSLGPCANEPAKQLPKVKAEHTAMPTEVASLLFDEVNWRYKWYDIDLHDRKRLPICSEKLFNTVLNLANGFNPTYVSGRFSVDINARFSSGRNGVPHAVLVSGMFMRSDLDGFTSKVEDAFKSGNIESLVRDFSNVLRYGDDFINATSRPIVRIPWAGDCANLVILPKDNETVKDAKYYYPATGAHDWLSCYDGKLPEPYKDAAWLVSICSGNASTGNSQILIAPIETDNHKFLFASGWGVGRSQDAQEQEDLDANEAVISKEDYEDLEEPYKKYFSMLNSSFAHSSTLKTTKDFAQTVIPTLMAKSHQVSEHIFNAIPQPRPHWR